MKKELEALERAYLNFQTAQEQMMRQHRDAFLDHIAAFGEFSDGHRELFNNLNEKCYAALARFQQEINTPPPLPAHDETESFIDQLRRTSTPPQHYS